MVVVTAAECRRLFSVGGFATTEELTEDPVGIIGQERAVEAMEFGLRAPDAGYHIYVAGPVGTGRSTYVNARLQQQAEGRPVPPDLCYVYDFAAPERPALLALPAGQGRRLQRGMERLVAEVATDLRRVFESNEYEVRRAEIAHTFERQSQQVTGRLEEQARAAGFAVHMTPTGIGTIPLGPKGEPMTAEAFQLLPEERQKELMARGQALEGAVSEAAHVLRDIQRQARTAAAELDRETATYVVGHAVAAAKEPFAGQTRVQGYLDAAGADMVEHLDAFRGEPDHGHGPDREFRQRYRVNVFVDNGATRGAPVVVETVADLPSLVGRVEFRGTPVGPTTDFTMLRPGALQRASGGYLVLPLKELLSAPGAYEALKRCLREGRVRLEGVAAPVPYAVAGLSPEPVPIQLKVVLIGPPVAYQRLLLLDEDFRKLFKVKVDFDGDMPASEANVASYAAFVASVCRREGVPHLTAPAVGHLLGYSSRLAEDQAKLSTRFNQIVDVIVSAGVWAREAGHGRCEAADVEKALREQVRRAARVEDRLLEATRAGDLRVEIRGAAVGQINGLTVINLGDYAFGRPSRITARAWPGRRGVTHVERETRMGGQIHTKGVLTLAAYLSATYGQAVRLAIAASLAFEQTYEEVDGDSASSAELYALLSELAQVPIRQGIAVTGSVDQRGVVQPIGGVNEKIEGFFRCCAAAPGGLTGDQGVVIPPQNVKNLALRDEVVAAVEADRFHLWSVETVDEGIELLTGVAAGQPGADGAFPAESVHGRVSGRLREFAARMAGKG